MPHSYLVGTRAVPEFPVGLVPGNGVDVAVLFGGHGMNVDHPDGFAQAITRLIGQP
jgi:hypothetical protein